MTIISARSCSRIALCGTLLLLPACENVPKYKKSSGKFDEWGSYEGKHFNPSSGNVTATDLKANTITVASGKDIKVLTVSADTRIIHEGTDITLAELPLKTEVKYRMSDDGTQLLSVWFGHRLAQPHPAAAQHRSPSYF